MLLQEYNWKEVIQSSEPVLVDLLTLVAGKCYIFRDRSKR